jgi:hypothetical protein
MGWRRRMQTYPAARAALRLIRSDPAFVDTQVAYASRTNKYDWATSCMRLLDIGGRDQRSLEQVREHTQTQTHTHTRIEGHCM